MTPSASHVSTIAASCQSRSTSLTEEPRSLYKTPGMVTKTCNGPTWTNNLPTCSNGTKTGVSMPTRTVRHATPTTSGVDALLGPFITPVVILGIAAALSKGGMQAVYRAELTAVSHSVQAANQPTHIVSDCLSVVSTARAIFYGSQTDDVKGDHADLWKQISDKVKTCLEDFYRITWIPSHTDLTKSAENEANGGHERSMICGNAHADREAKMAMRAHAINWEEFADADDRVRSFNT